MLAMAFLFGWLLAKAKQDEEIAQNDNVLRLDG